MPIQSHTLEQTTQANGSTHNVLRMVDQDGVGYMVSFFTPGSDVAVLITHRIEALDVQLAESEFEQMVGAE